ncbi:MAG TPA: hypothetical protein VF731_11975 [Solirubrobacterales bacterium]
MSRMPQRISPGARARRALLFDFIVAVVIALVVLQVTAGLGVVAFFGLPLFLIGLLWLAVEAAVRRLRRPRRPAGGRRRADAAARAARSERV